MHVYNRVVTARKITRQRSLTKKRILKVCNYKMVDVLQHRDSRKQSTPPFAMTDLALKMESEASPHAAAAAEKSADASMEEGELPEDGEITESVPIHRMKAERFDDVDYRQQTAATVAAPSPPPPRSERRTRRRSALPADDFGATTKRPRIAEATPPPLPPSSSQHHHHQPPPPPSARLPLPQPHSLPPPPPPSSIASSAVKEEAMAIAAAIAHPPPPAPSHMQPTPPPPSLPPSNASRRAPIRAPRYTANTICKFFRQGYCRDGENCGYSHAAADSHRRPELCRFYERGYCKRGLACPCLHGEFPCKAYNKGDCSKDQCQFSHSPLDDYTRPMFEQVCSFQYSLFANCLLTQKQFSDASR